MTSNIGESLMVAIKSKDAKLTLNEVQQYDAKMRDTTVGNDYIAWISEPVNLTKVHNALAEDLNVPPRLLSMRRQLMSRTQRAVMFIKVIEAAVKRVHTL
jgi:hypothetical protein